MDDARILVAYDFSDWAPAVLEHAAALARTTGLALELLHVAAPDPDFVGYEAGPQSVRDARAGTLRQEHHDLQEMARQREDGGIPCTPRLVEGPTIETILEHAAAPGVQVIVMGTRGKSGLERVWMGSVCEGVLQEAALPVLVIPKKAAEAEQEADEEARAEGDAAAD